MQTPQKNIEKKASTTGKKSKRTSRHTSGHKGTAAKDSMDEETDKPTATKSAEKNSESILNSLERELADIKKTVMQSMSQEELMAQEKGAGQQEEPSLQELHTPERRARLAKSDTITSLLSKKSQATSENPIEGQADNQKLEATSTQKPLAFQEPIIEEEQPQEQEREEDLKEPAAETSISQPFTLPGEQISKQSEDQSDNISTKAVFPIAESPKKLLQEVDGILREGAFSDKEEEREVQRSRPNSNTPSEVDSSRASKKLIADQREAAEEEQDLSLTHPDRQDAPMDIEREQPSKEISQTLLQTPTKSTSPVTHKEIAHPAAVTGTPLSQASHKMLEETSLS